MAVSENNGGVLGFWSWLLGFLADGISGWLRVVKRSADWQEGGLGDANGILMLLAVVATNPVQVRGLRCEGLSWFVYVCRQWACDRAATRVEPGG